MTTATTVASLNIFDKLFRSATKLADYQKYIDVESLYTAFVEAVLACACSCFPPMDAHITDDDDTPSEQKRVNTLH